VLPACDLIGLPVSGEVSAVGLPTAGMSAPIGDGPSDTAAVDPLVCGDQFPDRSAVIPRPDVRSGLSGWAGRRRFGAAIADEAMRETCK
jgi:hypothetical protein